MSFTECSDSDLTSTISMPKNKKGFKRFFGIKYTSEKTDESEEEYVYEETSASTTVDTSESTTIDQKIKGKVKKYMNKYTIESFQNGGNLNKIINLSNIPEPNPESDEQLYYFKNSLVTKDILDAIIENDEIKKKEEIKNTGFTTLGSCTVLKKIVNQRDCSTCHEDCSSCYNSHVNKWYDKIIVSSDGENDSKTESNSLTYNSKFKDKYYVNLYCKPINLLDYGTDLFEVYNSVEKETQNSKMTKYTKIFNDEDFEFVNDSSCYYTKKEKKKSSKKTYVS
uniref:EEV126 n=1 Tax=Parastrongyloides trichosuri TaxID=131310 RepID=A0A0N5A199_PARTI